MGEGRGMELPQGNLVMQAEQWKSRLVKEEEAYAKGREIRKKETDAKIKDSRERWQQSRLGRASVASRPPTSISSVYFDSRRPNSQQSVKTSSTVSMTGSEYRATLDRLDQLESNLENEKRARLAAEHEL